MSVTSEKTIEETQSDIVQEFEHVGDWNERYKHIIQVGRALTPLPEEFKTEDNIVRGCQSQVWLKASLEDGKVIYQADSDALIVRGLIALALRVYSGHAPSDILAAAPDYMDRIGMSSHLSMTRSNGLQALIKKIKIYALAYQTILARSAAS